MFKKIKNILLLMICLLTATPQTKPTFDNMFKNIERDLTIIGCVIFAAGFGTYYGLSKFIKTEFYKRHKKKMLYGALATSATLGGLVLLGKCKEFQHKKA